jgi:hypothetical protein
MRVMVNAMVYKVGLEGIECKCIMEVLWKAIRRIYREEVSAACNGIKVNNLNRSHITSRLQGSNSGSTTHIPVSSSGSSPA